MSIGVRSGPQIGVHVEREWIQWMELVAGLSAMIVLTLSLLAVWDGKSP
jgi:predicted small integral membrane protein